MTQAELTEYNLGKNLDSLINLDPRGYGVCRILYDEACKKSGGPLTTQAARSLLSVLKDGDTVFIITGFVLPPYLKAETDGPVGAAALARSLIITRNVKPVFVLPGEAVPAMRKLCAVMGFHLYDSPDMLRSPLSAGIVEFTKSAAGAAEAAEALCRDAKKSGCFPKYCIAVEAPGANKKGVYHNAAGFDVSDLEAKSDVLFSHLRKKGVPALAIGDLGNECGMALLSPHLERRVPCAGPGKCSCGCGGGIAAASSADVLVTATVSNWGAYALCAALAHLAKNHEALYPADLEERALTAACEYGLIDMYGWQIPSVDGMNLVKNKALITLMNECVLSADALKETCKTWFDKTIELGYFDNLVFQPKKPERTKPERAKPAGKTR
ncbi:MAG: DUF4392 domain-containing protein [Treponema sp.]|jgi:hypothetical protein|nr:DUF4392 domain-containing protein [Treponema sp.]